MAALYLESSAILSWLFGEPQAERSLDAIHLASILEAHELYPDLEVLSLDHRILANLEPLGLRAA